MISDFRGRYFFLSNFYPHAIEYEGIRYPTLEHAFQAAKTLDSGYRQWIASMGTPSDAKRFGRRAPLRPLWDATRVSVMAHLLSIKFSDPILRDRLLETEEELLVEGNWWGDNFWGATHSAQKPGEREWGHPGGRKFYGENMLGQQLMELRKKLRACE